MNSQNPFDSNLINKLSLFETLYQENPDPIWVTNTQGEILHNNKAAERLTGISSEEFYQSNLSSMIEIRNNQGLDYYLENTSMQNKLLEGSFIYNNQMIYVELSIIPILELDHRIGTFVIAKDITERIITERQLKTANEYFESFINHSADAIGLFDLEGNLLKVNKASEKIFGYTLSEQLGHKVQTIPSENYRQEVMDLQRKVLNGETIMGYETIRRRKDNTLIDVSITYSPIRDENGNIIAMANILRDITKRKRVEKELRESEEKYRLIAENTADLIRVLDPEGYIQYASPSHKMILGYDSKEYEGEVNTIGVYPDDVSYLIEQFKKIRKQPEPLHLEYRERNKNGDWLYIEARCMPVCKQDNKIDSIVIVARDITERKNTEELLRNSDKLSVVGELSASIAHEIRNPLTSLKGFLQFLQQKIDSNDDYFNIMLSELERINLIVSEFLLLSKPQANNFKAKNIKALLDNVIALLNTQAIMDNVQIFTHYDDHLPELMCEENQLKQAFINFLKNAIEASSPGSVIDIYVTSSKNHIILKFVNYGCGIPSDRIPKLGEPFYSTKEKGTGLGLMVSYKIIENHKGTVNIESQIHKGTVVTVKLQRQNKM